MVYNENMVDEEKLRLRDKSNDFICILYPEEDINHKKLFDYLTTTNYFKCVYIEHYKDKEIISGEKKKHIHMLIHTNKQMRLSGIYSMFQIWCNHFETCNNATSYIIYMLHDTPECREDPNKEKYERNELKGDNKLINKAIGPNSHFVSYELFIESIENSPSGMLKDGIRDLLLNCNESQIEDNLEFIARFQSTLCTISQQEFNIKRKDNK